MLEIIICDDNKEACDTLSGMLYNFLDKKGFESKIISYYNGEDLYNHLSNGGTAHIIFLDIELGTVNGAEIGNYIRSTVDNQLIQIIYVSYKDSYAMKLFKSRPFDFLIKPINEGALIETLSQCITYMSQGKRLFSYALGKDKNFISMDNIIYFTSQRKKVEIYTLDGNIISFYGRLDEVEEQVGYDFIRIHQSYLLNKRYISVYDYSCVKLANGEKLVISKSFRKSVRDKMVNE